MKLNYTPLLALFASWQLLHASEPIIKIDFNKESQPEANVNEIGYHSWVVNNNSVSSSKTIDEITFTLAGQTPAGQPLTLGNQWYKTAIQSPFLARLVGDCLWLYSGGEVRDGGKIILTIDGLKAGNHSLLFYLNSVETPASRTFANYHIDVDGNRQITDIAPTSRVTSQYEAQTAYIEFDATADKPVVITISSSTLPADATDRNIYLNGFSLNVSDVNRQIRNPHPADRDWHVDADNGSVKLSWTKAKDAISHQLYFSNNRKEVSTANEQSTSYKGKLTNNEYTVDNLKSINTYYWRIDEQHADGKVTQGEILTFKPRILAFEGAEGYGRYATGGRGGKVVYVTNLNDDGPGSLRQAVTTDLGPRTILFDVSGIITLKSRLTLSHDNIYVAGQTAPGKGICIRSAPFGLSGADDCIMRFVRLRLGAGDTYDGTGMQGCDHSIMDHISTSWTIDESFSSRSGKNITLQRSMLTEALNIADHKNYPSGKKHGYAATISGEIGSFHHNLLAHNEGRNWSLGGGLDANGYYSGKLDIFNNVVYNWGGRTTDGGAHQVNFVANYYKKGPATTNSYALNAQWDGFPGTQKYYCKGNLVENTYPNPDLPRNACRADSNHPDPWHDTAPFFPSYATIHTAKEAFKHVLSDVGCTMPLFDDHDQRIVQETLNGTTTYTGSRSKVKGLPDHQNDVGGYEEYGSLVRPNNHDTDRDGLPDWFELIIGTNLQSETNDFSDTNNDPDGDGYTHLDTYLEWMATPHISVATNSSKTIDLTKLTVGFSKSPQYAITTQSTGATVTLTGAQALITPTGKFSGLTHFVFTATDTEGTTLTRKFGLLIEGPSTAIEQHLEDRSTIIRITDNIVQVDQNKGERAESIKIYDPIGRIQLSRKITLHNGLNRFALNLDPLTPGTYLLHLDGQILRFVKNNK